MWKKVQAYALLWNTKKHKGIVKIILEDGSEHKIVVKSSSELDSLGNVLRNESPVSYSLNTGSIATGWEPLQEDEGLS